MLIIKTLIQKFTVNFHQVSKFAVNYRQLSKSNMKFQLDKERHVYVVEILQSHS